MKKLIIGLLVSLVLCVTVSAEVIDPLNRNLYTEYTPPVVDPSQTSMSSQPFEYNTDSMQENKIVVENNTATDYIYSIFGAASLLFCMIYTFIFAGQVISPAFVGAFFKIITFGKYRYIKDSLVLGLVKISVSFLVGVLAISGVMKKILVIIYFYFFR